MTKERVEAVISENRRPINSLSLSLSLSIKHHQWVSFDDELFQEKDPPSPNQCLSFSSQKSVSHGGSMWWHLGMIQWLDWLVLQHGLFWEGGCHQSFYRIFFLCLCNPKIKFIIFLWDSPIDNELQFLHDEWLNERLQAEWNFPWFVVDEVKNLEVKNSGKSFVKHTLTNWHKWRQKTYECWAPSRMRVEIRIEELCASPGGWEEPGPRLDPA